MTQGRRRQTAGIGQVVTGRTNTEEEDADLTYLVPFFVKDMLKANGGNHEKGDGRASFMVTDGKLVTCQNPASLEEAARKLVELI